MKLRKETERLISWLCIWSIGIVAVLATVASIYILIELAKYGSLQ